MMVLLPSSVYVSTEEENRIRIDRTNDVALVGMFSSVQRVHWSINLVVPIPCIREPICACTCVIIGDARKRRDRYGRFAW